MGYFSPSQAKPSGNTESHEWCYCSGFSWWKKPYCHFGKGQLRAALATKSNLMTWHSLRQLELKVQQWNQCYDTECIRSFQQWAQCALCTSELDLQIIPGKRRNYCICKAFCNFILNLNAYIFPRHCKEIPHIQKKLFFTHTVVTPIIKGHLLPHFVNTKAASSWMGSPRGEQMGQV